MVKLTRFPLFAKIWLMNLFNAQINNWQDWGGVFQSIPAFSPLVEFILKKEHLPAAKIENLTPGTNAVFKTGDCVVKIFAPAESGIDQTADLETELFAMKRANKTGVSAPKMLTHGFVADKYRFAYIITEHIEGIAFSDAAKDMDDTEKTDIGRKLRKITDQMNTECEPFNGIDIINGKGRWHRFDKYPEQFQAERRAYLEAHDFKDKVFVHGDLCGDNILLTSQGGVYIIDFADALLAPVIYEHALVAVELFALDVALMRGYFGALSSEELADICFNGLLIHDFGGDIIGQHIGKPEEFSGLDDLRVRFREKIKKI